MQSILCDRKPQIDDIKIRFKEMYPDLIEIPWDQKLTHQMLKVFESIDRAREQRDAAKGNVGFKKIAKKVLKVLECLLYIAGAIFQSKFFKIGG